MINVLFCSPRITQQIGLEGERTRHNCRSITGDAGRHRRPKWGKVLTSDKLLVAVNQTISQWDTPVSDGDEVAFSHRLPEVNMRFTRSSGAKSR